MRAAEWFLVMTLLAGLASNDLRAEGVALNGYRGIWYQVAPTGDQYGYKYSGGLGTYCAKHIPMAVYAPEVNKTFFVYGGTKGLRDDKPLLEMVSYYDHATGEVPRPVMILEKGTKDAHHNPTLSIDRDGYLWVFMSSHGKQDGFIYRSRAPYSIESFDRIAQKEFTYPQPWYFDGFGHVFLFTKYTAGRELYIATSPDGVTWSDDRKLVGFGGHYQVSWPGKDRLATAFDYHPSGNLDARTNLYYMETRDHGETWTSAAGTTLSLPLVSEHNDALVHDYQADGLLVYVKDLNYDSKGRPVILYVTSKGFQPGPKNDPRVWTTAHWLGDRWDIRKVTTSDHNYDTGMLHIERDGTWRVIGPTEPGPQPYCTGGEITMWVSTNEGRTWKKTADLTLGSLRNHNYARRPLNAHPGFYAFWADGDSLKPSISCLYFATRTGEVRQLPFRIRAESVTPHVVRATPPPQ